SRLLDFSTSLVLYAVSVRFEAQRAIDAEPVGRGLEDGGAVALGAGIEEGAGGHPGAGPAAPHRRDGAGGAEADDPAALRQLGNGDRFAPDFAQIELPRPARPEERRGAAAVEIEGALIGRVPVRSADRCEGGGIVDGGDPGDREPG